VSDEEEFSLSRPGVRQTRAVSRVVDGFLASPGSNTHLGAALALRSTGTRPIRFELERLTRMAARGGRGRRPIAEEDWESDVEAMEHSLERGCTPPLLVSHHDGKYFSKTATTASRHSAARSDPCVAILLFSSEEDRDRYVQEHGGASLRGPRCHRRDVRLVRAATVARRPVARASNCRCDVRCHEPGGTIKESEGVPTTGTLSGFPPVEP